ncbi:MAG TPA: sigma-70 family RNA polymerase sigma factor [Ktedonobacterales bacterium]|nr:sigma-70 family RNA polymerase sigma factor [Ktedonobacterales bacterium]
MAPLTHQHSSGSFYSSSRPLPERYSPLRAALAELSPQDSACLLLRVVHGFSAAEVGEIMGASAEVITKRLSRARQRLRAAYLGQNPTSGQEQR